MKLSVRGRLTAAAAAVLMCVCSAGCVSANAAPEHELYGIYLDDSISPKDGYYLSDKDESYIYVQGDHIGVFNFDFVALAEKNWYETDEPKVPLEEWIKNSTEGWQVTDWNEFKTARIPVSADPNEDILNIFVDYDNSWNGGSFSGKGYLMNHDGTIDQVGNTYTYGGTELPEGYPSPELPQETEG